MYHFRKDMNNVIRSTIPIGQILKSLKNAHSKYSQKLLLPSGGSFSYYSFEAVWVVVFLV